MASLGSLQFALHQPQRLARGEDGLPGLRVMSVLLPHSFIGGATYPAARHGETVGRWTAVRGNVRRANVAVAAVWRPVVGIVDT